MRRLHVLRETVEVHLELALDLPANAGAPPPDADHEIDEQDQGIQGGFENRVPGHAPSVGRGCDRPLEARRDAEGVGGTGEGLVEGPDPDLVEQR